MTNETSLNEAHTDAMTAGVEATERGPQMGHLVPGFRLETTDGAIISPSDYKERHNLVMVFCNPRDSEDLEVLAEIRQRYQAITDANAEVLAVAQGPVDELAICSRYLNLPYPLLSDPRGEATASYRVEQMMVFVADRFGELHMAARVGQQNLDKVLDEVESTLGLLEIQCPECGVPSWPID